MFFFIMFHLILFVYYSALYHCLVFHCNLILVCQLFKVILVLFYFFVNAEVCRFFYLMPVIIVYALYFCVLVLLNVIVN